jgi:GTP:adenosylcobinamide-phosphate guanylyltransferase
MDAIVTAGGIPQPQDSLYTYSHGDAKALIDVAGKPMIQWVLDALSDARNVENVIVIGLSAKSGLTCKKPLYFLSNRGRMLANIVAGVEKTLELNKKNQYVLIVSSDIPTVKAEHVDWLIDTCMETQDDIYYGICPRDVMETRFPDSHRTYTHLKDMDVCGADMNITHVRMATEHLDMWESLIGSRKSPLKQASIIGFGTLFALFMRRLTIDDAVKRVSDRIGIKGRAIVWQNAEPCMDVDKPHQLELLRTDLAKQQRKAEAKIKAAARRSGEAKPAKAVKKSTAAKKSSAAKTTRTKLKASSKAELEK